MPTQNEYNIVKQRKKELYAKIQLLNYQFQVVDEFENVVCGEPTFSNDSTSSIRRTCNLSLFPTDKSFDVSYGNKIWLDKYFKIYLGVKEKRTDDIIYSNMGIYMIENPSRVYSADNNTLSFQGVDLMAKMTGLRNGSLEGMEYTISQGENIRNVIISTIKEAGFTKYVVSECEEQPTTPYDISVDVGGCVYDILEQILDIMPNYQMYFDADGVFHYDKIPSGKNEQIMVDDDIWKNVLIEYSQNNDFDSVKNVVEVIGGTHDVKYYNDATVSGNTYIVSISGLESLYSGLEIGFTTPSQVSAPSLSLNSFGTKQILNEDGSYPTMEANTYYVVSYQSSGYYLFLGGVTPYGIAKETNSESPYYVNGSMGEVRIVLSGDEYDDIYSDSLAEQRAEWELYKRCRLQDSVSITCIPIYWLDTNWLIEITLPNKQGAEVTNQYLIKSISTTFGETGTQNISLMRYYPYYNT